MVAGVIADPDTFVQGFFGPGNAALPGADLTGPRGRRVQLYLAPLLAGIRRAMILPRMYADGRTDAYVVTWDPGEAAQMRRLIEAFVGHSLVPFEGRLSRLREDDPVDAAVIGLVGRNTTYVLRTTPDPAAQQALWRRLATLRDLLNSRPERTRSIPRPVGRLLAELRAAVAVGAAQTSAELLDELTAAGGISPLNLAYLRAHRLGRLGRSGELLRMPEFDDIVASRPPADVAEAILGAWVQVEFDGVELETADDVAHAVAGAVNRASHVAPLCAAVELVDPSVRLAAALVCLVRYDTDLAGKLLPAGDLPSAVADAVAALTGGVPAAAVAPVAPLTTPAPASAPAPAAPRPARPPDAGMSLPSGPDTTSVPSVEPAPSEESGSSAESGPAVEEAPGSWVDWVRTLGSDFSDPVSFGPDWSRWSRPVDVDVELASALEDIGDARADAVWGVVGPFLDADVFEAPAWRSAGALLFQAAAYDRWAPADLISVQALLEIFTRGAPATSAYAETLELIGGSIPRWASIANVERTLDIVDVLARAGCPDTEARLRFVTRALEPLHRGRWRLGADPMWLADQIGVELGLDWDWTTPGEPQSGDTAEPVSYKDLTMLVYSLDPGALQRTVDGLTRLAPGLKIHRSSHKAGTDQLRDQTRSADAIALATRCAKHAATGFIRQHARTGVVIQEADGAGSATLLRAAIVALDDLTSRQAR